MIRILITACLLISACKKKEDAGATAQTAPTSVDVKPSEAKPAGLAFATAAEYEAKTSPLMDAVIATYVADGTNCDKLAADLRKLVIDNKDTFNAAVAYEHAHPADKKVLAWSSQPYLVAAVPSINACKENKAYSDAVSMIPV